MIYYMCRTFQNLCHDIDFQAYQAKFQIKFGWNMVMCNEQLRVWISFIRVSNNHTEKMSTRQYILATGKLANTWC